MSTLKLVSGTCTSYNPNEQMTLAHQSTIYYGNLCTHLQGQNNAIKCPVMPSNTQFGNKWSCGTYTSIENPNDTQSIICQVGNECAGSY